MIRQPRHAGTAAAALVLSAGLGGLPACSSSPGSAAPSGGPQGPVAGPPASAGHSLVYANQLGRVVLVNAGLGGSVKPPPSTPTQIWEWTGAEWRTLDSTGPPIRNLAGVAYDTRRQALIMHGGTYDFGVSYGETWEWSAGWRRFEGAGPGIRDHTQLAFDPERNRAVLFGGSGLDPNLAFSDTWEFDGARWARMATAGPRGRVHHAMEYDPVTRRVLLFGGIVPGGGTLDDTWAWDGRRWTPLGPSGLPRSHARMVFDRGLDALLAVGGLAPSGGFDMLVRRGPAWVPLAAAVQPSPRYLTGVAYDERRSVLVLFGGGDPAGAALYDDTWEFDGTAWRRIR